MVKMKVLLRFLSLLHYGREKEDENRNDFLSKTKFFRFIK